MNRILLMIGCTLGVTYFVLRIQGLEVPELFVKVLIIVALLLVIDRVFPEKETE